MIDLVASGDASLLLALTTQWLLSQYDLAQLAPRCIPCGVGAVTLIPPDPFACTSGLGCVGPFWPVYFGQVRHRG